MFVRPPPPLKTPSSALWLLLAFAAAFAVLALPVMLTPLPPLTDLPNHYAQYFVERGGAHGGPGAQIYRPDWSKASSNIIADLIAASLGRIVPGAVLQTLILSLAVMLPPLGAILLNRQVFGRWTPWQIALLPLAWNLPTLAGFINFSIGLGLALLAAAAEPWLVKQRFAPQAGLRAGVCAVLLLAHPFGFGFYGLLLTALALTSRDSPAVPLNIRLWRWLGAVVALPAVFALFHLLHPASAGADTQVVVWQAPDLQSHLEMMARPFLGYERHVDTLSFYAFLAPVAVALILRRLKVQIGLAALSGVLIVAAHFVPKQMGWAAMLDVRLPMMAILAFAAGVSPDLATSPRRQKALAAAFLLFAAAKSGWVLWVWRARQADVRSVERVLTRLPRGAKVLPMEHNPGPEQTGRMPLGRVIGNITPSYWHLCTLAVSERQAFVPTLFAVKGQHPISVLPPYNRLATPAGMPAPAEALLKNIAWQKRYFPYMTHWRDYDYILVVNADVPNENGPMPNLPEIEPVADEGFAQLYRIRHPGR